jgi:hypothetical protein
MILLFANNAVSSIASPINAAANVVQLAAGDGNKFPNPIVGAQFFKMTFVDALTGDVNEIVNVTQRVGDILTIVRAQEGTIALPWLAGDAAKNMTTAQTQDNFIQVQQAQEGLTNFASDTGTPNSYAIALTPAVTERIPGLYARILAKNSNLGPSTLNMGAGSFPIINPDGTDLGEGAIIGGGIFEVVDDGTVGYQLISASQELQSGAGVATTGDWKWRPTSELIAGWIVANATTIGNAASNASQLANASAANVFSWHWSNFSNTQCPLFNSDGTPSARGLNPAADFAANKRIQVLDGRGIAMLGMDSMGGNPSAFYAGVPAITGNSQTPGSLVGEVFHALNTNELPSTTPAGTIHDGPIGVSSNANLQNQGVGVTGGGSFFLPGAGAATINASQSGTTFAGTPFGGNVAHNTVDRGMIGTFYIKQ